MASRREFHDVMRLVFQGRLRPVVDTVFPFERAREAYERLHRGEQFGKVVIRIP
jgi:NADPH:quinone reductase-like Zn-dependent oxidoreductase